MAIVRSSSRHLGIASSACELKPTRLLFKHAAMPTPARRRMLYHGPVDAVLPWFASLGFACPPR